MSIEPISVYACPWGGPKDGVIPIELTPPPAPGEKPQILELKHLDGKAIYEPVEEIDGKPGMWRYELRRDAGAGV